MLVFIFQKQAVGSYKLPNYNEHFDIRKMETGLGFEAGQHLIFQGYVYNPIYWILNNLIDLSTITNERVCASSWLCLFIAVFMNGRYTQHSIHSEVNWHVSKIRSFFTLIMYKFVKILIDIDVLLDSSLQNKDFILLI